MAAKALTANQHLILHDYWPNNCCLCNRELEITALKLKVEELEKKLEALSKDNLDV